MCDTNGSLLSSVQYDRVRVQVLLILVVATAQQNLTDITKLHKQVQDRKRGDLGNHLTKCQHFCLVCFNCPNRMMLSIHLPNACTKFMYRASVNRGSGNSRK